MNVHYDVEKVIAAFEAAHLASVLPSSVPNFAKIQHRNHAVAKEFMRMVLTEMNLGSSHRDVLLASANIMVDFIQNFAEPYEPDQRATVFNAFMHRIEQLLSSVVDGTENVIKTSAVEIASEEGGHA